MHRIQDDDYVDYLKHDNVADLKQSSVNLAVVSIYNHDSDISEVPGIKNRLFRTL